MDSYSVLYSSCHRTGLLSGFQRLRTEGKMCDVVLEAGGVSFPCHRALLASSSELAQRVILHDLCRPGSGQVPASGDGCGDMCERFIIDGLSVESCCCYANLAERHTLSNALEAANQTIAMEMGTLLQESKDKLLELNIQSLMSVLEFDEIPGVKELELIQLALDWLDENGPLPLLKSNLLLSRLRFGLVCSSDLANLRHRAMGTPLIRSQLTRAFGVPQDGSSSANQTEQAVNAQSVAHIACCSWAEGPAPIVQNSSCWRLIQEAGSSHP
ncbi:unnamed protein product [Pleuronectes platessa]|uniref:BTB domain-containing protein n=1 Tax=Pleuronectes platessa TaxID=8262 RepID=A0A9N7VZD0_PLEPL|nr:unnamed protein product [Pleuronectes platessa]